MNYLTPYKIALINKHELERFGQQYAGIEFPAKLYSVTKQIRATYFGKKLYPSIWLQAAYLLQKITKGHIFVDGNKRTSYVSTKLFLIENGYQLVLPQKVIVNFMISVTVKSDTKTEMSYIAEFLKKHSLKIT